MALRTNQRGRKPALTEKAKKNIRQSVKERPNITINGILEKLHLTASYSTVEWAVQAMGYTLKKKSLYASEHDRVRCGEKAEKMSGEHNS